MLQYPTEDSVHEFQETIAAPVMNDFARELTGKGLDAKVMNEIDDGQVKLEVYHGDELDFVYSIYANEHPLPNEALIGKAMAELADTDKYWRAEVHLREGGQDYDVMGWTREQLANDMLDQYERHLHYLHMMR